jgi:glycosyltransferase involved in cell wall biosynthesis
MGNLGKTLDFAYNVVKKGESYFLKTPRFYFDGYLTSAYLFDFSYALPISKIKAKTIITLDTLLTTAKSITRNRSVLLDLMDMWMWPWDEVNPVDIHTLEEVDGVIFWSKPLMKIVTKRFRIKKFIYIPYGLNLTDFDPLGYGNGSNLRRRLKLENKFLITFSGGGGSWQGLDLHGINKILKAFRLISDQLENAVLIFQAFDLDAQFLKLIKELRIENRTVIIDFLPFNSPDRLDLFSATDIFLAPNVRHPFAYYAERMKFFQYMAAAKPILTEKTPGTESVFGDTAYYVKLDDIDAMADAILKLHSDKNLAEKLGNESRKRLEINFEWSKLVPKYRDFVLSTTEPYD